MLNKALVAVVFTASISCAARTPVEGASYTLRWTPAGTPVTYNVYIVAGTGPVPTIKTEGGAIADRTKVRPANSQPLTGTSFQASLAPGMYTAAVEAVGPSGVPSALSNQKTFKLPEQH